jgi:hypothetical protein
MNSQVKITDNKEYVLVENLRIACPSLDVPEIDKEIDPQQMNHYTFYPVAGSIIRPFFENYEREYNMVTNINDNPMFLALTAIIENIKYHSYRQPEENRQKYFLESCYAYGFSDEDTKMLWEILATKSIN